MSNLLDKASIVTTPTAYENGKILSVKPNTSVGDFDFTRNSSATRVNSQGLIEDMQILSGDLVSNGDFSQEGSEQADDNVISNAGGSVMTKVSALNYNATSDETGGSSIRPRLAFNNTTIGKSYRIRITPTNQSGTINFKLYDGSQYIITGNDLTTDIDLYFKAEGSSIFIAFDGTNVFNVDFEISLKEVGQDWSLGSFTNIGNNVANIVNSTGELSLQQNIGVSQKTIKLTYTISNYSSGGIRPQYGAVNGLNRTANGTYTEIITGVSASTNLAIFSVTANTTATITNISVIEITDDTNLPRIDYTGGEGHWLFEPQSTNLITYSEDFSQSSWGKHSAVILTPNQSSPDGTNNAYKVQGTIGSSYVLAYGGIGSITPQSRSIYMRADTNGVVYSLGDNQSNQINVTTEWQRFELQEVSSTFYALDFRGSGVTLDSVYIWGAQLESQSYATSYIPTNGEVNGVTRLADAAFGAGSSDLINSTEGVLYAEIAALVDVGTSRRISLSDGTSSNRLFIELRPTTNQMRVEIVVGSGVFALLTNIDKTIFNKIAFSYKSGDSSLFINGVKISNSTSSFVFNTNLSKLSFDNGFSGDDFYGKAKCVAVFKEALTDAELTCLTTI